MITLNEDIINGGKGFPAIDKAFDGLLKYAVDNGGKLDMSSRQFNMLLAKLHNVIIKSFKNEFNIDIEMNWITSEYGMGDIATALVDYTVANIEDLMDQNEDPVSLTINNRGYKFSTPVRVVCDFYLAIIEELAEIKLEGDDTVASYNGRFFTAIMIHEIGHILNEYRIVEATSLVIKTEINPKTGKSPFTYMTDLKALHQTVALKDKRFLAGESASVILLLELLTLIAFISGGSLAISTLAALMGSISVIRSVKRIGDADKYYKTERLADLLPVQYGYAKETMQYQEYTSEYHTGPKPKNPLDKVFKRLVNSSLGKRLDFRSYIAPIFLADALEEILTKEINNPNNPPQVKKQLQAHLAELKKLKKKFY